MDGWLKTRKEMVTQDGPNAPTTNFKRSRLSSLEDDSNIVEIKNQYPELPEHC